jgi:hypothetical protein
MLKFIAHKNEENLFVVCKTVILNNKEYLEKIGQIHSHNDDHKGWKWLAYFTAEELYPHELQEIADFCIKHNKSVLTFDS